MTIQHTRSLSISSYELQANQARSFNMAAKKILIIVSDADSFPLHNTGSEGKTVQQDSGYFLMELAKPLQKFLDAGYEVTFASPEGKEPTPDPNSVSVSQVPAMHIRQTKH